MRSSLKKAIGWISWLPHPTSGCLIALHDGELSESTEAAIRTHLERCAYCRERSEQLLNGLRFIHESSTSSRPPFSVEAGLARLASAITSGQLPADDQPLPTQAAELSSGIYERLLSELSIYLGAGTAARLLDRCNHSLMNRERLSVVVGPVVRAFLGNHAGEAVLLNVLRIWDQTHNVANGGLAP
jgi:anti-sigma factor RsiW